MFAQFHPCKALRPQPKAVGNPRPPAAAAAPAVALKRPREDDAPPTSLVVSKPPPLRQQFAAPRLEADVPLPDAAALPDAARIRGAALAFRRPALKDVLMFPPKVKSEFTEWLHGRLTPGSSGEPVCFLMGLPGIGKRTLVYAAALECGVEVVEPDALELQDVVTAFTRSLRSSTLSMRDEACGTQRRVWLCTGLDGYVQALESYDKDAADVAVHTLQQLLKSGGRTLPPVVFTMNAPVARWRTSGSTLPVRVRVLRCKPANLSFRTDAADVQAALARVLRVTASPCEAATLMRAFTGDWRQALLRVAWTGSDSSGGVCRADTLLLDAFAVAQQVMRASVRDPRVAMELLPEACGSMTLLAPLLHTNVLTHSTEADMDAASRVADAWSDAERLLACYAQPLLQDAGYAHLALALGMCPAARRIGDGAFLTMPDEVERYLPFKRRDQLLEMRRGGADAWTADCRAASDAHAAGTAEEYVCPRWCSAQSWAAHSFANLDEPRRPRNLAQYV